MNSNIKPTFLNYITDLEQSDLVGLLTDLVTNEKVTARTLQDVLKQNNIEIPEDDTISPIVGHNIKVVLITYSSNYNGCHVEVLETVDDSDVEAYQETDAFETINDQLINMVVEHASDECGDEGVFYGDIERLGNEVVEMVQKVLGRDVVIHFDEDGTST